MRFKCKECKKTFTWKVKENKKNNEKHWFYLWVKEGYSIRQLSNISGYSEAKLKRIKNYWLGKEPPAIDYNAINKAKYLIFDGTYFHKNGCLAVFLNSSKKGILSFTYIEKESYYNIYPLLIELKNAGLNPKAITLDGHIMVIRAILEVFSNVTIQRCLYHIQRQGLQWLRVYPKTQAGKELKLLLIGVTRIRTEEEKMNFINTYENWRRDYKGFIKSLPKESVANVDLKKTMALINNALPDMFHYLNDSDIAPTTNLLENFYSQLKHQYRGHRGLTEKHKVAYLKWFCYFKYVENNHTF